jgi:hypothetical protein
MFLSSGEGKWTPTLLGPLEGANLSHWSPEDGIKSNFRNIVFSSCLEFPAMDKVHKPSDSECYTPSSEPFRFYDR